MEQYTEIQKLGSGSFGVAVLVKRNADGKMLVSKRMRLCGMSNKEREDALNEARLLSKIQHLYVTHYYESLFDKGVLCIIMEFAPNGDLGGRLRCVTPDAYHIPIAGRVFESLKIKRVFFFNTCGCRMACESFSESRRVRRPHLLQMILSCVGWCSCSLRLISSMKSAGSCACAC